MSYILDALKKSEQQRELVRILGPAQGSRFLSLPVRLHVWPTVIGIGLIAVLSSLALWWYTDIRYSAVGPLPSGDAIATTTVTPENVELPEPKKVETSESKKAQTPEPSKTELPVRLVAARPAVDDLIAQTRIDSSKTKRKKTGRKVSRAKKRVATARTAAVEVNARLDWGAVPFLRQMPDDFRANIPDMVVNVHLYSADVSENLVYINNRQYRKGERIQDRIRLEEIVREGVVLNYNGVRFKLPRPN